MSHLMMMGCGSTNGGVSPTDFSGLTLWLDGADTANILDGSGNPITNGTTVGTWKDKSGNARNFTQGTDANRPTWNSAGYVSVPGGAPSSSVLLSSGLAMSQFLSSTNNTIFIVFRVVGTPAGTRAVFGDANLQFIDVTSETNLRGFLNNGTGGQSTTSSTIAGDTDYIYQLRRTGTTLAASLNGGTEASVTTSGSLSGLTGICGLPRPGLLLIS